MREENMKKEKEEAAKILKTFKKKKGFLKFWQNPLILLVFIVLLSWFVYNYLAEINRKMNIANEIQAETVRSLKEIQNKLSQIATDEEKNFAKIDEKISEINEGISHINAKLSENNNESPQKANQNKPQNDTQSTKDNYYLKNSQSQIHIINLINSSIDQQNPSSEMLTNTSNSMGINLIVTDANSSQLQYLKIQLWECILVSYYDMVSNKSVFERIKWYSDNGGNVIILQPPNQQKSIMNNDNEFDFPLRPVRVEKDWDQRQIKLLKNEHPIFEKIRISDLKHGQLHWRVRLGLNAREKIDLVATWDDNTPIVAVDSSKKGLITSIGVNCGVWGSSEWLRVVVNAIRLRKNGS